MSVTVGIKALNEGRNIARTLSSAVAAVAPMGGTVILADSGSIDDTVAIAQTFPVRIVQLANPAERCCGAGAQLAFQHADGDYFYILDGDMVLHPDFLKAGIAYLEAHPQCAAVGGIVNERNVDNEEFQIRAKAVRDDGHWSPGAVDRLDCGGLYRMAALRQVGYFADRNLHAFEEFDLAARLRSRGWQMARIDHPAVDHFGHTTGGYSLLMKRFRSGYAGAPGEVLRGAIGHAHLSTVLTSLGHVRNGFAVMLWWLAIVVSLFTPARWLLLAILLLGPLALLSLRRGSLRLGIYSLASWNVSALGLLTGLFRKRTSPDQPLGSIDLTANR
ncbi:glycosyltransferase [Sphingobium sp.]|uniref:glycosyltransferase n=1 Tax=Sphingobium sp. TaxID=1912891 RepID=UPI003BB557D4